MPQLKLYNYFRSSTSYRVRIALAFKNLKYEYIPIHLLNNGGEQNSAAYRSLNPMGGVPTLEHDGKLISQSFAIIEYIDEVFKTSPSLLPADPFLKAKVRQACEIINADTHPLHNLKVLAFLENTYGANEENKQHWMNRWIVDGLTAFTKTIQPYAGQYCFGDKITAADLFLVPQMVTAVRFKVDISQFLLLKEIYDRCLQIEAFNSAHPFRQPDTPADLQVK